MANDKAPSATEAPAGAAAPKGKAGFKMAIAAILVLGLEAGTVGITMKMSGGPSKAGAAEPPITHKEEAPERDVEVKLIADRLPNSQSGRQFVYDLQVVVKVSEKNKGKVTELFAERDAEIRDQVRTIIASSDPQLRRKISYQLEQVVGKDLLKEVLIPRCTAIAPMM
jgi:flagellar basal body-associated protein FliL